MAVMMSFKCVILLVSYVYSLETVTLKTKLGQVTGTVADVNGTKVHAFLGIPYAKPPVGNLRFSKPEPYGVFGNLRATDYAPACLQPVPETNVPFGQEDCLTLDIYAPVGMSNNKSKAVMIWIHGGGYDAGLAPICPGHILAATGDVVVVTIQYRLNILGFLTTGDSLLPGNLGLWDQHLALNWIKSNIGDYGGNVSAITIFGESAGGSAVMFQAFSPMNDASVFQRVIAQSPWLPSPNSLNRKPQNRTSQILKLLNCPMNGDLLNCLRKKTTKELLDAYLSVPSKEPSRAFPISDNDFLPANLGYLIESSTKQRNINYGMETIGNFYQYDLLGGWTDQDGLLYTNKLLQTSNNLTDDDVKKGISDEDLVEALNELPFSYLNDEKMRDFVVEIFKNYYLLDPKPPASTGRSVEDQRIEAYTRIAGDATLKLPFLRWIQLHSLASSKKSYLYEYRHKRPSQSLISYEGPSWLRTGANHADDIFYVFGYPFFKDAKNFSLHQTAQHFLDNFNFTAKDRRVSRQIMTAWANFAKTGDPGISFQKFSYPREQAYTAFSSEGTQVLNYPLEGYLQLWASVVTAIETVQKGVTVRKRLDIVANYTAACDMFNAFKNIIIASAKNKYAIVEKLVARYCNKTDKFQTQISCASDVTTVSWPTGCMYQEDSAVAKEALLAISRIVKSLKEELNLVIPNHIPPVIQPLVKNGVAQVAVVMTSL